MGSGNWEFTPATSTSCWDIRTITNLTIAKDTSTVVIGASGDGFTFLSGGITLNNISIGGGGGIVEFSGSNTFSTFTITAPRIVKLTAGTTTTVSSFVATGDASNLIHIDSTSASPAYLVCKDFTKDDNSVAIYSFSEGSGTTIDDLSNNSNTGTFKGTGEPAWDATDVPFTMGNSAPNSVVFDKVDDYINIPAHTSINNLSAITITAWIKPISSGEANGYILDKSASDTSGWRFRTQSVSGNNQIGFRVDATSDVYRYTADDTLTALLNTWVHVAVTWDGSLTASNIHIYINGVESATYDQTTNGSGSRVDDSGNDIYLGNRSNGGTTFDGNITDVGLFSRVLTIAEINQIRNYGLTNNVGVTNTVHYCHIGETGAVNASGGATWDATDNCQVNSSTGWTTAGATIMSSYYYRTLLQEVNY